MPYDDEEVKMALWVAAYDAVLAWAEIVLGAAQREAPVDEGTLRGSGVIVEHTVPGPGGVMPSRVMPVTAEQVRGVQLPSSSTARVGKRAVPRPMPGTYAEVWIVFPLIYARYQHEGHREDGSYIIQNHPKGGKTHYLEDPFKQYSPSLPRMIQAAQLKVRK